MPKKDKEDERIERIIRALLKLPENRRCINCNSLGPQYVCTTFNTFICINCSGVQEFTHRVKSVSMATFNPEEVNGLQAGGNERARQIYFKVWDPQRNSYPDGSNLHRLRDFIKHVYVDRRFTGERTHQNLPRLRMGGREVPNESTNASSSHGDSTSPTYRNRNEQSERFGSARRAGDMSVKYYYDERRSPRYSQENSRHGGYKKSPARFVVVDDRVRDDRRGRQPDRLRFSHRDSGHGSMSPAYQNNMDRSNSPVVRSMKDILGDNFPRLRVGEHSKQTNNSENQMIASPTDGNSEKQIIQSSHSLIDFDADPGNSVAVVSPQTQENQPSNVEASGSSNESYLKDNAPPVPKPNSFEMLLLELSGPPIAPAASEKSNDIIASTESSGNVSEFVPPDQMLALSDSDGAQATGSAGNLNPGSFASAMPGQLLALPAPDASSAEVSVTGASTSTISPQVSAMQTLSLLDSFDVAGTTSTDNSSDPITSVPQEHQDSGIQFHQLALPAPNGSSAEVANNQLNPSNLHTTLGHSSSFAETYSQDASKPVQDTSLVKSQSLPAESTFGGRKELPADLFTYSYSPVPAPIPGWQMGQNYGMAYGMQYYPQAMHSLPSSHQAVSTNPFDCGNEAGPVQAPQYRSMGNFQGMVPSPSYAAGMPQQPYPYALPGPYMSQQGYINTPPSRLEGAGGSNNHDPFASLNIIQQPSREYSLTTSTSLPSHGGNPFG